MVMRIQELLILNFLTEICITCMPSDSILYPILFLSGRDLRKYSSHKDIKIAIEATRLTSMNLFDTSLAHLGRYKPSII
jgi:hypothetical protein